MPENIYEFYTACAVSAFVGAMSMFMAFALASTIRVANEAARRRGERLDAMIAQAREDAARDGVECVHGWRETARSTPLPRGRT